MKTTQILTLTLIAAILLTTLMPITAAVPSLAEDTPPLPAGLSSGE